MPNLLLTRPDLDEAEISLFGPGIGECALIHYGNGRWFVIDSCLSPENQEPVALTYLESIGVDVSTSVLGILVTHWHEDHIKGISKLIKKCGHANFYLSAALMEREAIELALLFKKDLSNTDTGIREFREVIAQVKSRQETNRIKVVSASTSLFHDTSLDTRMIALSPSSQAQALAIVELAGLLPKVGGRRIKLFPRTGNFTAVAAHFTFGNFSVLLGSDLEDTGNPNTGWTAVLNSGIFQSHSLNCSQLYKVAHHGSVTGHHQGVWDQLLEDRPLSIATPFISSKLPTEDDIVRISGFSSQFIVTRDVNAKGKVKRDPMVERELSAIVNSRKVLNDKMGHIQVRAKQDGQYLVRANRHSKPL